MNPLSLDTTKRLIEALSGGKTGPYAAGQEVAAQINNAAWAIPLAIVATSTSTTVNFTALLPGDFLVHIPATAGNSAFQTIVTAGTKPTAAIVGDLYIAIRAGNSAVPVTTKL